MISLADQLFREVRPDFFRILSGSTANAAVYVDVLDALDTETAQGSDALSRAEALNLIVDVLGRHPEFQPEEESPDSLQATSIDVREKSRWVLDRLARAGWVEAQTATDWQKSVFFDAHGATLLAALRKIAQPDAAVFTDKLVGVCAALANQVELARQPWEHLENCRDSASVGLAELRSMQKTVERLTRRQLEAHTIGDNLNVVFDQYAEQVGHGCYAELDEAPTLPPLLLPDARLLSGRDSLYEPPRRRTLEENAPLDDATDESWKDRARAQMESALRDSLSVVRANRLVERLPGGKGAVVPSQELRIRNEDDIADVIALLLHAESGEARYRIEVPRVTADADTFDTDSKAGYRIERFQVIKK